MNESEKRLTGSGRGKKRRGPCNVPCSLQALYALMHRGRRQTDRVPEPRIREPRIRHQSGEYFSVKPINGSGSARLCLKIFCIFGHIEKSNSQPE